MVLPSAYLSPISWFVSLMSGEPIFIEQYEHYQKQTIRNRCTIDSPNGPLNLSIPIDKSNFVEGKCLMKDVRISTHLDWQHQHWYALETSYFSSPFFEYLQDDFRPFYERPWKFLIDFNEALTAKCLTFLSFHKERKPIQALLPHLPSLQNRIIRCFSKSTALFPTFPLLTSSSTWVMKASSSCEIDSRRMMVFRNKERNLSIS